MNGYANATAEQKETRKSFEVKNARNLKRDWYAPTYDPQHATVSADSRIPAL